MKTILSDHTAIKFEINEKKTQLKNPMYSGQQKNTSFSSVNKFENLDKMHNILD